MNAPAFDHVTKGLATRLSRRAALTAGALGALAVTRPSRADDSADTPALSQEESEKTEFLFVQTFDSGTWTPKEGADGVFALALTGHEAQTVYFSDRPERVVGTAPTPTFLDGLGFDPDNPPNAAVVAQTDAGEDILVVELLNPAYREGAGSDGGVSLTYDARPLAGYQEAGLAHLAARQGDADLPASFGAVSLFIDDCADHDIICLSADGGYGGQDIWQAPQCWDWSAFSCQPCPQDSGMCNDRFPSHCHGECSACRVTCVV